jgi:putative ABC transport system permease protein
MTPEISLLNLSIAFVLTVPVLGVLLAWRLRFAESVYAIARMLVQLLVIGYLLAFIFETRHLAVILTVLAIMMMAAAWISLNALSSRRVELLPYALISIAVAGGLNIAVVTQGVLDLSPWYQPRFLLPLAGMIFSAAMNSVSLAAERVTSELTAGKDFETARATAFRASLIPVTNSMFAVGLVALPGMMTGQILGGVSPLVAVRYQIMVMCMLYSAAGIAAALFLTLSRKRIAPE